jgi:hypothetical protein
MLALDPELSAYDLLDISTNKMPDIAHRLGSDRLGAVVAWLDRLDAEAAGGHANPKAMDEWVAASLPLDQPIFR